MEYGSKKVRTSNKQLKKLQRRKAKAVAELDRAQDLGLDTAHFGPSEQNVREFDRAINKLSVKLMLDDKCRQRTPATASNTVPVVQLKTKTAVHDEVDNAADLIPAVRAPTTTTIQAGTPPPEEAMAMVEEPAFPSEAPVDPIMTIPIPATEQVATSSVPEPLSLSGMLFDAAVAASCFTVVALMSTVAGYIIAQDTRRYITRRLWC